jgi:hypothetical protein
MLKDEKLAYEYGYNFNIELVPLGQNVACCFDNRMESLISESRTQAGSSRNLRIMKSWYKGFNDKNN